MFCGSLWVSIGGIEIQFHSNSIYLGGVFMMSLIQTNWDFSYLKMTSFDDTLLDLYNVVYRLNVS